MREEAKKRLKKYDTETAGKKLERYYGYILKSRKKTRRRIGSIRNEK